MTNDDDKPKSFTVTGLFHIIRRDYNVSVVGDTVYVLDKNQETYKWCQFMSMWEILESKYNCIFTSNSPMKQVNERLLSMADEMGWRKSIEGILFSNGYFLNYKTGRVAKYNNEFVLGVSKYEYIHGKFAKGDCKFFTHYLYPLANYDPSRVLCLMKMFSQVFRKTERIFFDLCDHQGGGGKSTLASLLSEMCKEVGDVTISGGRIGQEFVLNGLRVGISDDKDINKEISQTIEALKKFSNIGTKVSIDAKFSRVATVDTSDISVILIHNNLISPSKVDKALLARIWPIKFEYNFINLDGKFNSQIAQYCKPDGVNFSKEFVEDFISFVVYCMQIRGKIKNVFNQDKSNYIEAQSRLNNTDEWLLQNATVGMNVKELFLQAIEENVFSEDATLRAFEYHLIENQIQLTDKKYVVPSDSFGSRYRRIKSVPKSKHIYDKEDNKAEENREMVEWSNKWLEYSLHIRSTVERTIEQDEEEIDLMFSYEEENKQDIKEEIDMLSVIDKINEPAKYKIPDDKLTKCFEFIAFVAGKKAEEAKNISIVDGELSYSGSDEWVLKNLDNSPLEKIVKEEPKEEPKAEEPADPFTFDDFVKASGATVITKETVTPKEEKPEVKPKIVIKSSEPEDPWKDAVSSVGQDTSKTGYEDVEAPF